MTITELKAQLDELMADAGADLEVAVDGSTELLLSWSGNRLSITTLPAECFLCGQELQPFSCIGIPHGDRCCPNCSLEDEEI